MGIHTTDGKIFLENRYARIAICEKNGLVASVYDKKHEREMIGADTHFFSLLARDRKTEILPIGLHLEDKCITVQTEVGCFTVRAEAFEDHFVFELTSHLPKECFKACLAHVRYDYDYTNKKNTGAVGLAMTFWANPCFYPDAKAKESKFDVLGGFEEIGAKYALIIAPIEEHRQILKTAARRIDKKNGIVSELGGAFAVDAKINFGNYILQWENSPEFVRNSLKFYKILGVDEIDFIGSKNSFRYGDFSYRHYKDGADFKNTTTKLLAENGIGASFHTCSYFLNYDCEAILSVPKWQKDLAVLERFTLAEDLDRNASVIRIAEDEKHLKREHQEFSFNTPFLLIGEELIRIDLDREGICVLERGAAGTKAAAHKRGEEIKHINGSFYLIAPRPGSELFYHMARETAKAYNEGGYRMLYLDAMDLIYGLVNDDEDLVDYYIAAFVCEVLKYCDRMPILEYSLRRPCLWAGRGRIGNFDCPRRGYRSWNENFHLRKNYDFMDMFCLPSLGWYCFYHVEDEYPANTHCKYQHTEIVEYMGALAAIYNFNIVYMEMEYDKYERYPALRRNVEIYTRCDKLRKEKYFSQALLERVKSQNYDCHIAKAEDGSYVFVQKDYQYKKMYDLSDDQRNTAIFKNPFRTQTPFMRIEALMASGEAEEEILLPIDAKKELCEQELKIAFDGFRDFSKKLARKVSILGNGKEGGAIAIKQHSSDYGTMEFIIDTNFEGWRDFILVESDNGDRPEYPFDKTEWIYGVYRIDFRHDRVCDISVETTGDISGVRMSSIAAVDAAYEVLKNPMVRIGDAAVTFECELMSTDYIEYDGQTAKVIDRYGNEKSIRACGNIQAPSGDLEATLHAVPLNRHTPRARLTLGFTGEVYK